MVKGLRLIARSDLLLAVRRLRAGAERRRGHWSRSRADGQRPQLPQVRIGGCAFGSWTAGCRPAGRCSQQLRLGLQPCECKLALHCLGLHGLGSTLHAAARRRGPVQYTDEPSGITGYSISPDSKTILYTLFAADGGTAIWALNADGTGRRLVLDCPRSECNSPRWYPNSSKIAYDRLDDATEATVPRFSIWWLDLASGKTQPMFRDQSFASYAPDFSPDGQWLSYISTADNTLILYDLQDGSSRSIPLGLQAALRQLGARMVSPCCSPARPRGRRECV